MKDLTVAKNSDSFFSKLRVFAEKLRVKTEKTQVKNAKTQVSRDPQILPNTKNRSKNKPGIVFRTHQSTMAALTRRRTAAGSPSIADDTTYG